MAKVVVGMLGFGTVGTGVIRLLNETAGIVLKKVAVRDLSKKRNLKAPCEITGNPMDLVDDPEIEVFYGYSISNRRKNRFVMIYFIVYFLKCLCLCHFIYLLQN